MTIFKIKLSGQRRLPLLSNDSTSGSIDKSLDDFDLKDQYEIQIQMRSGENEETIEVKLGELYELYFEDDTFWIGNADSLSELFPNTSQRGEPGTLNLPKEIEIYEEQRNLPKKIIIKFFGIFVKNKTTIITDAFIRKAAEKFEDKLFKSDNSLGNSSSRLFSCSEKFVFDKPDLSALNKPYLLMIHGTGSSTSWCFGDLMGTQEWRDIRDIYGESHILALENRTLTRSPLQNALDLIQILPSGINLDIICHSRGGIIADILERYSSHQKGWDSLERAKFQDSDRNKDIDVLSEIEKQISGKKITIRKVVRVGVPAAGTTLLSKRLDIFFNIFFNLLNIIPVVQVAAPVFSALKNLLLLVAERRSKTDILPGLEAMIPDSPFIDMLNSPGTEMVIKSPLFVISGNVKLDIHPKAVLTLISKLFYLGANDFVVDTLSMDKGTPRAPNTIFVYHLHSSEVSHISYFKIESVRKRIANALSCSEGEIPQYFLPKGQNLSRNIDERNALLGLDGGTLMKVNVSGEKPIVLILPGIMGSNLLMKEGTSDEFKEDMLWINYFRFLRGDLTKLEYMANNSNRIEPHSLVATSYKDMAVFFNNKYDVVTFPFDWRIPISESANRLNLKIQELLLIGKPVRVIAHSMGGVLLRNWMFLYPEIYNKLNKSPGFKAVFLGSPLEGSYRIPYVLFGKDGIVKKLAKIDGKNSIKALVKVFATMPGLLNLLPIQSEVSKIDFSDIKEWEKMQKFFEIKDWPIPKKEALDEFGKFQKAVQEGRKKIHWGNLYYFAGLGRRKNPTISDIEFTQDQFSFIATNKGDESVTWESGIPKELIAEKRVFYADTTHGGLSTQRFVFKAIEQIFLEEKEIGLSQIPFQIRGKERIEEKNIPFPEEVLDLSEESLDYDLLNIVRNEERLDNHFPLKVWVSNGDLKYADYPVLAGHFKFDGILTSEAAIDRHLSGELRKLIQLNLYPGDIGSNIVVLNHDGKIYGNHFKGSVVIGLGIPGELSGYQLMKSVEQGVARYLMIFNGSENKNQIENAKKIGISCIALANDYGGLSNMTSVRSIISGINRGNQKIAALFPNYARLVEEVEFIEIYRDTAINLHKCISQLEYTIGNSENFDLIKKEIKPKSGRLNRIPMENSRDWWTRITVKIEKSYNQNQEIGEEYLKVAMSTNGASEKVAEVRGDFGTFRGMVDELGKNQRYSPDLAKTMFERLIPVEFKEEIKRQNNIVWVLDKDTASFPWEMMQDNINTEPLCVHAGMVRQLSTYDVRVNSNLVTNRRVMVIGDPQLEKYYNQLPGAKKEAEDLTKTFESNGYETVSLINRYFYDILLNLYSKEYKILHLAGHGVFDPKNETKSGMLIGNKKFLCPADIKQMGTVPEMVFVNCCYLGQSDAKAEELSQNRNKLAANIGTQLIEIGVKAVIVAGWAIDDSSAYEFAMDFYQEMFLGNTFGDAIKQARKKIHRKSRQSNNSWGAYQCYGDPFFRISDPDSGNHSRGLKFSNREEAEIELGNMLNKVDSGEYFPEEILQKLAMVTQIIEKQNLISDKTIELSARLFGRLGKYEEAVDLYKKLLEQPKSEYTVKSLEEYCNIETKSIVYQHLKLARNSFPVNSPVGAKNQKADIQLSSNERLERIDQIIIHLSGLCSFSKTGERLALLASANKRKMMLYENNSKKEIVKCLKEAEECYKNAYSLKVDPYYANNILSIRQILLWLTPVNDLTDFNYENDQYKEFLNSKLQKIDTINSQDLEYWDLAFQANTLQTFFLLDFDKIEKVSIEQVYDSYKNLWNWTGNYFNKLAEIENLEILIKPLESIQLQKVKKVVEDLKDLKGKLESDLAKMMG